MKILLLSFIISSIVVFLWWFLFKKFKILDNPFKYKDLDRKTPVPKLMGVFLILASILSIVFLIPGYWKFTETQALFAWWVFLWIIAILDEIKWISPKFRLLIQILVAIIGILWWAMLTHINFFWEIIQLPVFVWILLSLIWFVLIINSLNWFDWINWMWAWIATVWFFTIALLIKFVIFPNYDIPPSEYEKLLLVLNLSLIFTSVSFVATLLELKPHWLIRDVGIMFLGYALAYLSLLSWAKVGLLLVVLSLVIFDAFWVIINRLKNKQNPMKWDYTHFHHRLMRHWRKREEIRAFVWIWAVFFMIIMILQWTNSFNKLVIFGLIFIIFFWVHIYMYWIKKLPVWLWKRDENI